MTWVAQLMRCACGERAIQSNAADASNGIETAKDDGFDYNLAFIETDFLMKKREPFDPDYMKALFDCAFEKSRRGYAWQELPILQTIELLRTEPP